MKGRVYSALCAFLLLIFGCATGHKAGVDERSLDTQVVDEKIETTILAKFIGDENIKTLGLTAKSFSGNVFLVGEYDLPAQQARAVAIVQEVEGVKSLTPYLLPKKSLPSCGASDNAKIRAEIETKWGGDKTIRSANAHVRVLQCRAVLLGILGGPAEIQAAISHARSVKGVQEVKSYLRVKK
jgi:hyperosmotically inducible protein